MGGAGGRRACDGAQPCEGAIHCSTTLPHPPHPHPQAYAFRALIPLHFHCEGPGCPTINVLDPTTGALVVEDRWRFVESQYELSYDAIWSSIGLTAVFVLVFQALNVFATFRIRHISR